MITFLLDQNVNRKSLWNSCNLQGLAAARRFPRNWATFPGGFKDPELLSVVMAGADPLLTNDRRIAAIHASVIPNINPGIIIVGHPPSHAAPIRKGELETIIGRFKMLFPAWHSVSWSNSVVEVTPISVEVGHIEFGALKSDEFISRGDEDWPARLENWLKRNSDRKFVLPS